MHTITLYLSAETVPGTVIMIILLYRLDTTARDTAPTLPSQVHISNGKNPVNKAPRLQHFERTVLQVKPAASLVDEPRDSFIAVPTPAPSY